MTAVREQAFAKLNLVLQAGRPRPDGLHPLCSLFASVDLADDVRAEPNGLEADSVECPGVAPEDNLAAAALAAFRERVPSLPPVGITISKRIPVAAGLGGGSADAAAALRAANRLAGEPLDASALREIAQGLGSDVPSQVEPGHALVGGIGEIVERVELPALAAVLAPQKQGLSTAAVYAQFDRMGGWRDQLEPDRVRALASTVPPHPGRAAAHLAAALHNDLQPAALALRPGLAAVLEELTAAGALGSLVSGSGPTCFGLFRDRPAAETAAAAVPGAILTVLRTTRTEPGTG